MGVGATRAQEAASQGQQEAGGAVPQAQEGRESGGVALLSVSYGAASGIQKLAGAASQAQEDCETNRTASCFLGGGAAQSNKKLVGAASQAPKGYESGGASSVSCFPSLRLNCKRTKDVGVTWLCLRGFMPEWTNCEY